MLCDECGHEYTSVSSQKRADTCVKDHKARRTATTLFACACDYKNCLETLMTFGGYSYSP